MLKDNTNNPDSPLGMNFTCFNTNKFKMPEKMQLDVEVSPPASFIEELVYGMFEEHWLAFVYEFFLNTNYHVDEENTFV